MNCGFEGADATAVNFRWISDENAATIRVQPQEGSPVEGDSQACSWEGKLRWVDRVGFRVRKIRDLCTLAPKDVVIDDWGVIRTKARLREKPRSLAVQLPGPRVGIHARVGSGAQYARRRVDHNSTV